MRKSANFKPRDTKAFRINRLKQHRVHRNRRSLTSLRDAKNQSESRLRHGNSLPTALAKSKGLRGLFECKFLNKSNLSMFDAFQGKILFRII